MINILKKEINTFFSSLIGYITIAVFLLITGLFLWVFPETNIINSGFASLDNFFLMAPWIFMFLIPALSMRSISEEYNTGTIEILNTKPLTDWQIVLGKYFAVLLLLLASLIPTLIYYYTVYQLGSPIGNIDTGATNGSYIGLMLLAASFSAIGMFASSLSNNQIVAFILAVFLCFFFYTGFEYLSLLDVFFAKMDHFIEQLGLYAHYNSISRGVVDLRDVVYFISFVVIFLFLTVISLQRRTW